MKGKVNYRQSEHSNSTIVVTCANPLVKRQMASDIGRQNIDFPRELQILHYTQHTTHYT